MHQNLKVQDKFTEENGLNSQIRDVSRLNFPTSNCRHSQEVGEINFNDGSAAGNDLST